MYVLLCILFIFAVQYKSCKGYSYSNGCINRVLRIRKRYHLVYFFLSGSSILLREVYMFCGVLVSRWLAIVNGAETHKEILLIKDTIALAIPWPVGVGDGDVEIPD